MRAQHAHERLLAHALDDEAKDEADHENEGRDLHGVVERRAHDARDAVAVMVVAVRVVVAGFVGVIGCGIVGIVVVIVAVAVLALAQLVDVHVPVSAAPQRAGDKIHDKARDQAHDRLGAHDGKHLRERRVVGDQHRDHLVGGREDHRDERAHRDDAPREERGRHGREPALRHGAEQGAHHGAGGAGARDGLLHAALGRVLERLHRKVGHEQEGYELCGIFYAVYQHIYEKVHGFIPAPTGAARLRGSRRT